MSLIRPPGLVLPGPRYGASRAGLRIAWHRPAARGLRALFLMNEACGPTVRDLCGQSHGTIVGSSISWMVGNRATGLEFTGHNNSDRVDLGTISSGHPLHMGGATGQTFLARLFIPVGSALNSFPRPFDKSTGGSALNGYTVWLNEISPYGYVHAWDAEGSYPSSAAPTEGVPHILGITRSGSSVTFVLYHDGDARPTVTTGTAADTSISTASAGACIGNWPWSTDRNWRGWMEFQAWWAEALPLPLLLHLVTSPDPVAELTEAPAFPVAGSAATGASHSITGAVTTTLTPAAAMDVTRHRAIAGAVTLALSPSAVLDVTRHRAITGDVTLALTPAGTLDVTRHHALSGAVTLTLSPAAVMDITRHHAIAGDVPLVLTPAATLAYTDGSAGPGIVGDVTLGLTPGAALDVTRHRALSGAVTLTLSPAAALDVTRHHALTGGTTLYLTPAAAMTYRDGSAALPGGPCFTVPPRVVHLVPARVAHRVPPARTC